MDPRHVYLYLQRFVATNVPSIIHFNGGIHRKLFVKSFSVDSTPHIKVSLQDILHRDSHTSTFLLAIIMSALYVYLPAIPFAVRRTVIPEELQTIHWITIKRSDEDRREITGPYLNTASNMEVLRKELRKYCGRDSIAKRDIDDMIADAALGIDQIHGDQIRTSRLGVQVQFQVLSEPGRAADGVLDCLTNRRYQCLYTVRLRRLQDDEQHQNLNRMQVIQKLDLIAHSTASEFLKSFKNYEAALSYVETCLRGELKDTDTVWPLEGLHKVLTGKHDILVSMVTGEDEICKMLVMVMKVKLSGQSREVIGMSEGEDTE
ncbi:hypothetical protein IQ07DRAFT_582724 [Pyrenochaeta sp. DS3sAY3a]|nr:hypothetical protein IQ07DRAFT_582724 [Pyrenochaeta sp. DS3sAY3a]